MVGVRVARDGAGWGGGREEKGSEWSTAGNSGRAT